MRWTLVVALTALAGCASLRPAAPTHVFLERGYVFKTPVDTSLLFEAQAATHIFLLDGLPDALDAVFTDTAKSRGSAWRLIMTPMFRIRQLQDSSAAVRTPSFMPRLGLERDWVFRSALTSTAGGRPQFNLLQLLTARASLVHHSNGQAGCFRDGFEPIDRRANVCRPRAGVDTSIIRLNRADGDFSSTFVNGTGAWTLMDVKDTDLPRWTVAAALGADLHPSGIFGALSDEQRALYGGWRLHQQAEGMWRWLGGRSRMTQESELAPATASDLRRRLETPIKRYRWSLEFSHSLDWLLGAGLFVRWHDGQDYYNIGFARRRKTFNYGVMLDIGGQRVGAKITD